MAKPWRARRVRTMLRCTLCTSQLHDMAKPWCDANKLRTFVRQLQGKHILLGDDADTRRMFLC